MLWFTPCRFLPLQRTAIVVFVVCLVAPFLFGTRVQAQNNVLVITQIDLSNSIQLKDNTGTDYFNPAYAATIKQLPDGTDAIDTAAPAPGNHKSPCAFIKGTTTTVTFTLYRPRNAGNYSGTVSLTPNLGTITMTATPSSQSVTVAAGASTTVSFGLNAFPNTVYRRQTLNLPLTGSGGVVIGLDMGTGGGGLNRVFPGAGRIVPYSVTTPINVLVYIVYSQPLAPLASPWVGVLDDSCEWAHGLSSETDVGNKLTTGLYNGGVFSYLAAGNNAYGPKDNENAPHPNFALKSFFKTMRPVNGNCMDVSDYLAMCMCAQGITGQVQCIVRSPFQQFTIKPNKLIGGGSATTFYRHQVASINYLCYDACLALQDLSKVPPPPPSPPQDPVFNDPAYHIGLLNYWPILVSDGGVPVGSIVNVTIIEKPNP